MNHQRTTRRPVAVTILAMAGLVAGLAATERRPVPAFPLTLLDGTQTSSSAEVGGGTQVLVYVSPGSPASDRLLRGLKQWDSAALRARTLVVLGRDLANAREWVKAAGDDLQPLRFAVDVGGEGWRALNLTGAPHVIGIEDAQVKWVVSGVLQTPSTLESVVKTWVARP